MSRSMVSNSCDDFFLGAGVRAEAVRFAAVGADLFEQGFEAGEFAAGDDGGEALAGEAAGDGPAGGVAGADDQD